METWDMFPDGFVHVPTSFWVFFFLLPIFWVVWSVSWWSSAAGQLEHFDRLWRLRLGEAEHRQRCILGKYQSALKAERASELGPGVVKRGLGDWRNSSLNWRLLLFTPQSVRWECSSLFQSLQLLLGRKTHSMGLLGSSRCTSWFLVWLRDVFGQKDLCYHLPAAPLLPFPFVTSAPCWPQ